MFLLTYFLTYLNIKKQASVIEHQKKAQLQKTLRWIGDHTNRLLGRYLVRYLVASTAIDHRRGSWGSAGTHE